MERKMSKSYGNTIPLFAEYEEIKKCVMSIVDWIHVAPGNYRKMFLRFTNFCVPERGIEKNLRRKSGKYKELKEFLIEDLEKFIKPLREKRKEFAKDIPKALQF